MKFDADQLAALARINESRNVFVTGPAGTGKSSITVEAIRQRLGDRGLRVCATTGVAAINLRDKLAAIFGQHVDTSTVYRWAGIGLGPKQNQPWEDYIEHMQSRSFGWRASVSRIRSTSILIIDEVSMLPGAIIGFVDFLCRVIREDDRPFGGIQIVAVGDFLQLPPVSTTGMYDWAFMARAWNEANFASVSLRTIHRQDDPQFISVLNQFRAGAIRTDSMRILMGRVAMFPRASVLRLMTHNTQVDRWNHMMLDACDGTTVEFHADVTGGEADRKALVSAMITPAVLRLRAWARVMVTANLSDGAGGLLAANGEVGTVLGWTREQVRVLLDNGRELDIEAHEWTLDPTVEHSAMFRQFPLRLAWASTIHKSQGLTLDEALVDIRAAREPGQAYVAISRVRSLSGLHLKDAFKGVVFSPIARDFHRKIEQQ